MSKPLELTIYPKACTCFIDDEDGCRVVPLDCLMHGARVAEWGGQSKKRLTEAEMAAEYWHAEMQASRYSDDDCWSDDLSDHRDQLGSDADTLHRFATHPHYFEATEPESDTE